MLDQRLDFGGLCNRVARTRMSMPSEYSLIHNFAHILSENRFPSNRIVARGMLFPIMRFSAAAADGHFDFLVAL